ncbi:MAG: hypothetical protein K1X88_35705 [Nannocystaceae bacterium]|nr:hypothetical protein [Nannocystaceae bacterium]
MGERSGKRRARGVSAPGGGDAGGEQQTRNEDPVHAFLSRLDRGTRRTNDELLAQLREVQLGTDEHALEHGTRLVTRLLTKAPLTYMRACLGASHWQSRIADKRVPTKFMRAVASRMNRVNRRAFELYEADYGTARKAMHRLDELAQQPEHAVPYFEVLVQNAAVAVLGDTEIDPGRDLARLADDVLPRLLDERGGLLAWIDQVVAGGESLKHYGGDTNTVVGLYDWIREDPDLGFGRFPTDAACRLDLGAGFGTPYLESLFGVSMLALDLKPPSEARRMGLVFAVKHGNRGERRRMNPVEQEAYLDRLERQAFRRYDVFAEPLPTDDAASIFVVSFGFLSSTVSSLSPLGSSVPPKLRPLLTTYTGVRRILGAAGPGKDLALLTVHRATSRAYMNRAVFLRFRDGRLSDHGIVSEPFQGRYTRGVVPARRRS